MDNNSYDDYYGDNGIPGGYQEPERNREPERDNPFYQAPRQPKRGSGFLLKLWRLAYPILIHAFGIQFITGIFMGVFLAAAMLGGMYLDESAAYNFIYENQIAISGVAEMIVFVPLLIIFIRDEQKRKALSPQDCLNKKRKSITDWLVIASLAICLVLLVNLFVSMLNLPQSSTEQEIEEIYEHTGIWVEIAVVGIIAPLCEEMVFRGLVFRRLREYIDPVLAALLSGIAFGVYHGNLEQGIFAGILGFVFAMLYEHYGTITVPIFCHMLNNMYATFSNEFIYGSDFEVPDLAYYLMLAAAVVASVELPIFIFRDDEKCNEY